MAAVTNLKIDPGGYVPFIARLKRGFKLLFTICFHLSGCISPIKSLEDHCLQIYKAPVNNHDYIMTVDVSRGRGQDYSTFNLIDISVRPFKQVAVYRNNTISPLLFPNIIYKYAKSYNDAYVIIEANDQGGIVCTGLYYDLEYENCHVRSALKADQIGVEMNR